MNTQQLTEKDILLAAELIRTGELVGIPTETVYGLGANGLNADAVQHIFEAKGRPQDNPLILHIPETPWIARYCKNIPDSAYQLAERFWPGPLTMILERQNMVPDIVTAGLNTVGMRCPDHAMCREVIRLSDVPIAAPSGNTSGRPSPTTAQHMMEDMQGKISAILDGGSCHVGVESTIIDLTCTPPRLLRPGGVTLEELQNVLGEVIVDEAVTGILKEGQKPRAPGMKYRHYAPNAPVTVVTGTPNTTANYIALHCQKGEGIVCFDEFTSAFEGYEVGNLGSSQDIGEQARRVFDTLRKFDHTHVTAIWAQCPDQYGLGLAVANRLNKAAGFRIIHIEEK